HKMRCLVKAHKPFQITAIAFIALFSFATSAGQTSAEKAAKSKRDAYIRAHGDQVVPNRSTTLMLEAMEKAGIKVSKPVLRKDTDGNILSDTQAQGAC